MRRSHRLNELRQLLPAADWWGWRIVWSVVLFITAVTTVVVLVVALVIGPNPWRDGDAYLDAALRLREGLPLYPELADTYGPAVYRYAPWFAYAWIPLSYLPRDVVIPLWQLLMLGCSGIAIIPAWRASPFGRVVCVVMAPLLLFASLVGNVQPAIVALLAHTIRTGGGPVAVAFAASLKLAPALYAVTYLGRRQWARAAITVALTLLLWAPALLLGVDHYPAEIGDVAGLWAISPFLWGVVAAVLLGASFRASLSPHGWMVSSLLVALAPPRFISYDWTYLLAGFARRDRKQPERDSAPREVTRSRQDLERVTRGIEQRMRPLLIGLAVVGLLTAGWIYLLADRSDGRMLIVARRGDIAEWPENTLEGVLSAARKGADGIELDIRQSADGTFWLMHDETVDRTTNGTGAIGELSDVAIDALTIDGGLGYERQVGLHPPTLDAVLDVLEDYGGILMLDAKGDADEHTAIAHIVVDLDLNARISVQSPAHAAAVRAVAPIVTYGRYGSGADEPGDDSPLPLSAWWERPRNSAIIDSWIGDESWPMELARRMGVRHYFTNDLEKALAWSAQLSDR